MLRFIKWSLIGVLSLALSFAVLYFAFGLRIELAGSGTKPLVAWGDLESHYEELERHRAQQPEAKIEAREPATAAPETASSTATASEQTATAAEPVDLVDSPPAAAAPDRSGTSGTAPSSAPAESARLLPDEPWAFYRGTDMRGVYPEPIRTDWSSTPPKLLYEQPIGGGYASFSAGGGAVYTIEQRRDEEVVVAYDPRTGLELWSNGWSALFQEAMGGDGPRATPAYADGRLFALGATGELRAFDARTGEVLWRTNILEDAGAANITWGQAASPLVVGERVITVPGGRGAAVIAYRASDGEELWRALDDRASYAAPMLVELAGKTQLLITSAERLVGLTLDGEGPLWEYPWTIMNDVNAAQPIVIDGEKVFVSSGYGKGAALFALERDGEAFTVRELWRNTFMKNRFSSSVVVDGHVYGLDEGIMACVDLATGARRWKGGRYGHGQLLLAGEHILVLTEKGELVLVRPTPEELVEVARMPAIRGKTWNNPAIVDGVLLVRNATEMAAFELGT